MKKLFTLAALCLGLAFSAQAQFEYTRFIGAMGPNASDNWTAGWCNWTPNTTNYAATTVTVSGDITTNTTWTSNNVYLITGFVYVKNGATLTIQPGTVIRGDKASKGSLIITRGAKINAQGTAANPIVFTSNQPAGSRTYGDWGGVIILGRAVINQTAGEAPIEGGVDNANGDGKYGGTDNNDNSGNFSYCRIEFPGIAFQPNSEINGLTMGGLGRATSIHHVQVSYSGDDSYEWFGGCVAAHHMVAFRGWDDDFDTDNGYSGLVQYGIGVRDSAIADISGSNGFESDNDATASSNNPTTSAIFTNMTIVGPAMTSTTTINSNFKRAAHLRRNTQESIYNSIIMGYPVGLLIDGAKTLTNLQNDSLQFRNNIIAGMKTKSLDTVSTAASNPSFDIATWFNTASYQNRILATTAAVNLVDPFNYNNPDVRPASGSPAERGSSFENLRLGGIMGTTQLNNTFLTLGVYPNPSNDAATLTLASTMQNKATVTVVAMNGQVINTQKVSLMAGENRINLSTAELPTGIYLVRVQTAESLQVIRLEVAH